MTAHRRRLSTAAIACGLIALASLAGGCASAHSPTGLAIERGDAHATPDEERVAPMASRRRGLLVAGDGFGRMAYSSPPTTATASADDE
jgi:hypothetical protein